MKDIAEHILDITQNSIRAEATTITIAIQESKKENLYLLIIDDDGTGMDSETLEKVIDPFYTSRITRKVGLGIPLLKQNAELAGGTFKIESELKHGTHLEAKFQLNHIDRLPVGDLVGTYVMLIAANPDLDFEIIHQTDENTFTLKTLEIKQMLEGISLNQPEVRQFLKEFFIENLTAVGAEFSN